MSEEQKRKLEQQLWNIANTLRGKMNADEFRVYILGFIFYKYLSEKIENYADSLLEADKIKFRDINKDTPEAQKMIDYIRTDTIDKLGYFLKPSELFSQIAKRGNSGENSFILEDLKKILNNIENSTLGEQSEEDFQGLFEDMD